MRDLQRGHHLSPCLPCFFLGFSELYVCRVIRLSPCACVCVYVRIWFRPRRRRGLARHSLLTSGYVGSRFATTNGGSWMDNQVSTVGPAKERCPPPPPRFFCYPRSPDPGSGLTKSSQVVVVPIGRRVDVWMDEWMDGWMGLLPLPLYGQSSPPPAPGPG